MTIDEMHTFLDLRVQKINSNAFDNILPEEKDVYINDAIDQFVKDRVEPRSNKLGLGFEQSIKRIEDLRTLLKTSEIDTEEHGQILLEGFFADTATLPADHFLPISVALKIQYNDEGVTFTVPSQKRVVDGTLDTDYKEKRIPAKPVQHDDIYSLLEDPFNSPGLSTGIITIDNDKIISYTDDRFITDKVVLTYIRQPQEVSLSGSTDCDLSANTHREIVDIAAKNILSDIQSLGQAQMQALDDLE